MGSNTKPAQPIVIFGGFLSADRIYFALRESLAALTGQHISVVQTRSLDWLPSVSQVGWAVLLRKLDRAVQAAAQISATGKVTLIGHSAGGVLSRLYLSPQPFYGQACRGYERVSQLITLGSPHHNRGGLTRGGYMAQWIERHYPGAAFSPFVSYTAVAGQILRGDARGTPRERMAYRTYRSISGQGNEWGDGLVPTSAALLRGAQHITLTGVAHYSIFGADWYGSEAIIPLWWQRSQEQDEHAASSHPIGSAAA
jgi:pimeloyl-ACP methyl ester carboxylesterase